jgi:hypothetical protein
VSLLPIKLKKCCLIRKITTFISINPFSLFFNLTILELISSDVNNFSVHICGSGVPCSAKFEVFFDFFNYSAMAIFLFLLEQINPSNLMFWLIPQ